MCKFVVHIIRVFICFSTQQWFRWTVNFAIFHNYLVSRLNLVSDSDNQKTKIWVSAHRGANRFLSTCQSIDAFSTKFSFWIFIHLFNHFRRCLYSFVCISIPNTPVLSYANKQHRREQFVFCQSVKTWQYMK